MLVPSLKNITSVFAQEIFDETIDSLQEGQVVEIARILNENKYPVKQRSRKETLDILRKNIPEKETIRATETLLFTLSMFFQASNSYEDFKETIERAISEIKSDSRRAILSRFISSLEYLPQYYSYKHLESYKTKANNYYLNMEYCCDMRGRFSEDYNYKDTPFQEYLPEFVDLVPIISLYFQVSDGENSSTCIFQVSEEELDEILSNLYAAQKQLKILKEKVRLNTK